MQQLECVGGPLDGAVLTIDDEATGFLADPVKEGAPRSRYLMRDLWFPVRGADGLPAWYAIVRSLIFDDWVSF